MSESLNHLLSISMTNSLVWTWKVSIVLVPISHTQVPASLRSSFATLQKKYFWYLATLGCESIVIWAWSSQLGSLSCMAGIFFTDVKSCPANLFRLMMLLNLYHREKLLRSVLVRWQAFWSVNFTKNHCHHWVKNSLLEKVPSLWIECESVQRTFLGSRDYPSELAAQQVLLLFGNMRI